MMIIRYILASRVSEIYNLFYFRNVDIYNFIILVYSGTFAFIVVYELIKISAQRKFRNEKRLTDEEILAILETNDYDH